MRSTRAWATIFGIIRLWLKTSKVSVMTQYAFMIWLGCFLLGMLGYGYSYMLWHFSYYLVTNQRLRQVRQKGFFKRTVVDLDWDNIQSLSFGVNGVFGAMFNYGTILIQTGVGDLTLSMVSHPETVYNKIENAGHGESSTE